MGCYARAGWKTYPTCTCNCGTLGKCWHPWGDFSGNSPRVPSGGLAPLAGNLAPLAGRFGALGRIRGDSRGCRTDTRLARFDEITCAPGRKPRKTVGCASRLNSRFDELKARSSSQIMSAFGDFSGISRRRSFRDMSALRVKMSAFATQMSAFDDLPAYRADPNGHGQVGKPTLRDEDFRNDS